MPSPTAKVQPVLEVNRRPVQDLRQLIELVGQHRVEWELNVHRTTVKRWLAGQVKIPGHQHQVIRMLLGDLPGTCGQWTRWMFRDGDLVSPAGDRFTAGQVLSLVLLRQQLTAQQAEIQRLKIRLAMAEQALQRTPEGAANEALDLRARA